MRPMLCGAVRRAGTGQVGRSRVKLSRLPMPSAPGSSRSCSSQVASMPPYKPVFSRCKGAVVGNWVGCSGLGAGWELHAGAQQAQHDQQAQRDQRDRHLVAATKQVINAHHSTAGIASAAQRAHRAVQHDGHLVAAGGNHLLPHDGGGNLRGVWLRGRGPNKRSWEGGVPRAAFGHLQR